MDTMSKSSQGNAGLLLPELSLGRSLMVLSEQPIAQVTPLVATSSTLYWASSQWLLSPSSERQWLVESQFCDFSEETAGGQSSGRPEPSVSWCPQSFLVPTLILFSYRLTACRSNLQLPAPASFSLCAIPSKPYSAYLCNRPRMMGSKCPWK